MGLDNMSDLAWQPFYDDVETLMSGHKKFVGKTSTSTRFRNFEQLGAINNFAAETARAVAPTIQWTLGDTARIVVSLIEGVENDRFDKPALLAIKICAGFRDDPLPNDRVSGQDPELRWSSFEATHPDIYNDRDSFSTKIKIRRLFASPLYEGANVNHFDKKKPSIKRVTEEFLHELKVAVETEVTKRLAPPTAVIERPQSAEEPRIDGIRPPVEQTTRPQVLQSTEVPLTEETSRTASDEAPELLKPAVTVSMSEGNDRRGATATNFVPAVEKRIQSVSPSRSMAPTEGPKQRLRATSTDKSSERTRRSRGRQTLRQIGILMGGALVAGVLAVGVYALIAPVSAPSSATLSDEVPTAIRTYVPGDAEASAAADLAPDTLGATCWERSYVSARKDARLCALGGVDGGLIYDPCFVINPGTVTCFSANDIFSLSPPVGVVARITESRPAPSFLPMEGLVGAEQAAETRYPWAIKLAIDDPGGVPYVCAPLPVESANLDGVPFACGGGGLRLAGGEDNFVSGGSIYVQLAGTVQATKLDTSTDEWTISIADPATNSLKRVGVVEAWY